MQQAAIPLARAGSDLLVQAKSGTGKTAVFGVACIEHVNTGNNLPQVSQGHDKQSMDADDAAYWSSGLQTAVRMWEDRQHPVLPSQRCSEQAAQ